jgi:hypothetical protein
VFSTAGSDFDTVLSVWTGSELGFLAQVGCNDNDGAAQTSRLIVPVTDETVYSIMVAGNNNASGVLQFSAARVVPNDDFANRFDISGSLPYDDAQVQNNYAATTESGEPTPTGCGVTSVGRSAWFTFTPSSTGKFWLDTAQSNFDTVMAVYTGSTLDNLTQVACDNDGGFNHTSFLELTLNSGTTYQIMVGSKGSAYGNLKFHVAPSSYVPPTPPNPPTPRPAPLPAATSHIGLYQNGIWLLSNTLNSGNPDLAFIFGAQEPGWTPLVGDWDGDLNQVDTIGLYRNGVFLLRDTNGGGFADKGFLFGPQEAGWTPVAGDWNGDRSSSVGVYQNGVFLLTNTNDNGAAEIRFTFGPQEPGWTPLVGDWNGDGIDTVGVYKDGMFLLTDTNAAGSGDIRFSVDLGSAGLAGWLPVVGDWDKDGSDSIGLYKDGVWWLRNSNSPGFADLIVRFGPTESGWQPVSGRWDSSLPLGVPVEGGIGDTTPTPETPPTLTLTPTATASDLAPTAEATETPVAPTETATASESPAPTATPSETTTLTPTAADTMPPTATDAPLPSATPTPTETLPPAVTETETPTP